MSSRTAGRKTRDAVLGSQRRLGLWILPLFVMVALLASTLVGALAVLYYGQRVSSLEATTATVAAELEDAVERVNTTAEEAEDAIAEQVRRVRESLAEGPPIESPNDAGIYAVSAAHRGGEVRVGSGMVLVSVRGETAVVTNYRVVATPDGFALPAADIHLPQGTFRGRVHNFDRDRDLAVLVLAGGPLPVPEWRPSDERVTVGDLVYLAGIAGPGSAAVVEGKIAAVGSEAVVTNLPLNAFVSGGPLLDVTGRVVAISSMDYAPFGQVSGDLTSAVPIREVCRRLIRCTREDMGPGELGDEGGVGAVPQSPEPEPDGDTSPADPAPPAEPPPPHGGEQP